MWGAWLLHTLKAEQTKYFASVLGINILGSVRTIFQRSNI
jgi:hypothetical protein